MCKFLSIVIPKGKPAVIAETLTTPKDAHRLEDCSNEFQQFYSEVEPSLRPYYRFLASQSGGWASLDVIFLAGQNNGLRIARSIQTGTYVPEKKTT